MPDDTNQTRDDLFEVWYDCVSARHLAVSIFLGTTTVFAFYHLAIYVLTPKLDAIGPEQLRGYALLAGVAGATLAGVLLGVIFKPKRILTEQVVEPDQILALLADENVTPEAELRALAELPNDVKEELVKAGVFDTIHAELTKVVAQRATGSGEQT